MGSPRLHHRLSSLRPLALALLVAPSAARAASNGPEALGAAIELYRNLDDSGAAQALHSLLRHAPVAAVAAKAHLYLALIALNAAQGDDAKAELREALSIDPTVLPPTDCSPKVWELFAQLQREQATSQAAARPREAAPITASPAPPLVAATAPERPARSHAVSYALFGIAGAALVGGVGFGLASRSAADRIPATPDLATSLRLASQAGTDGAIADVGFGLAAASAVAATIVYLVQGPGGQAEPLPVRVTPVARGAALLLGRAF